MSLFFAQVTKGYGGGWATHENPDVALRDACRHVGLTAKEARKETYYVLEFPDAAVITMNSTYGSWSADIGPTRVERRHNISEDTNLLGKPVG